MNNKKDEFGNFLPDVQRLTTFGKILRKSSLDELPQLFNILIGDMAIVGPRPKTVEESYFIRNTNYICRHSVRPGITGLAIIKGRNELDPDKAFRIDLEYVSNMNLWLDMKIFIKTFLVVIFSFFLRDVFPFFHYQHAVDIFRFFLRGGFGFFRF